MKILALIVALFFTINSIAVAPYGFRGQNQTATQYSNVLQFPNSQVTKLSGINSLVETGNKNILLNPDFENNTFNSSWTATTVTPAVETTTVISGKKSVIMTPSAQTFTFVQDSTLYASNFQGSTQLLAMVWIRTNQNGVKVCSRNDGVTSTTNCVIVAPQSPSVWQLIKIPFISSSTSNGISIAASSAITGNVYIDDAFVGAVDLKQDVNIITPWTAYTPTYTGFGTVTNSEMQWRQVGQNVEIRGKFTAGTTTAVEARVSLPNSYVSAGTSVIPSIQSAGGAGVNASSVTSMPTIEPSVSYFTFGQQVATGSGAFTKIVGSSLLGSGSQLSVTASIPIAGLQGATSIYSASCGANCVDTFSAKVSSAGVVSGENVDWINGNAVVTDTSLYTLTFNTSIFSVSPNCVTMEEYPFNTDNISARVESFSSSSIGIREGYSNSGTTGNYSKTTSAFRIICQKTGADFVATRTIVGSFSEVMTTPGVSRPEHFSASYGTTNATTVCSASPCSYLDQIGNAVSSITRTAQGTYSINLSKTYTKLKCSLTSVSATANGGATLQSPSCSNCSSVSFAIGLQGTSAYDSYGTLLCDGIP